MAREWHLQQEQLIYYPYLLSQLIHIPVYLCSYKNNTLKFRILDPKNSGVIFSWSL